MKKEMCSRNILFVLISPLSTLLLYKVGANSFPHITLETSYNSAPLKAFTSGLYEAWESVIPVDFTQMDNFETSHCLIVITNFIGTDIVQLHQPVVARRPIPAIFQEDIGRPVLGWILENLVGNASEKNFSCFQSYRLTKFPGYPGRCERFHLWKISLKSKLWKCEVLMDMFPPFINTAVKRNTDLRHLLNEYEDLMFMHFEYPGLWNYDLDFIFNGLQETLVSRVPIIQNFMVSADYFTRENIVHEWLKRRTGEDVSVTSNIVCFLVGLITRKSQVGMLYSVDYIHHIHQQTEADYSIIETDLRELEPVAIRKFLGKVWSGRMNWFIYATTKVEIIKTHLDLCKNVLSGHPKPLNLLKEAFPSPNDMVAHVIVHIWQSILRNYTYSQPRNMACENGKRQKFKTGYPRSELRIHRVILKRLLHYPMQISNPLDGSFRFVVCGMQGSESIAFLELINAYDDFVWIFSGAFVVGIAVVWELLARFSLPQNKSTVVSKIYVSCKFYGKLFSLTKTFLEQGDLNPDKNLKIRVMIGSFLVALIVLSNGYKNANVYNMVTPRKPIRYETFRDLMKDNFTVFHLSLVLANMHPWFTIDWHNRHISQKRISQHKILYYLNSSADKEALSATLGLPELDNPRIYMPPAYWESNEEIELSKFVRNHTCVHSGNVLMKWIERFKLANLNWESALQDRQKRLQEFAKFLENDGYAAIEKEFLFKSLHECNKTALILRSNEATSYSRILTSAKGNAGREVYFKQYLMFELKGFLNPPLLSRLSSLKESGILEWWESVIDQISIIKFERNMTTDYSVSEHHPSGTSMEGNIIVVFSVLGAGLLLGCTGFILEVFWKIGRTIRSFFIGKSKQKLPVNTVSIVVAENI